MGTTAQKLEYLNTTKQQIKSVLNTPSNVFRDYVGMIQKYINNNPTSTVTNGILSNALDVPVKNYKVFGNSTQNTTTGKNFAKYTASTTTRNGVTFTHNEDDSISVNGTPSSYIWFDLSDGVILPAGTYTFAVKYTGLATGDDQIQVIKTTSESIVKFIYPTIVRSGWEIQTFTLTEETKCKIRYYCQPNSAINNQKLYVMLISGSYTSDTMPEYEPYTGGQASPNPDYPQPIYSVGDLVTEGDYAGKYKVPIKVSGKNSLNIPNETRENVGLNINIQNNIVEAVGIPTRGYANFTPVFNLPLSAGSYILSIDKNIGTPNFTLKCTYEDDTNVDIMIPSNGTTVTVNLVKNIKSMYVQIKNLTVGESYDIKIKPMLRLASIADDTYEPYYTPITTNIYLDEPLRGIGTVKDYIDFITQKRHNLIGRTILNGSETYSGATNSVNSNLFYVYTSILDTIAKYEATGPKSNMFVFISNMLIQTNDVNKFSITSAINNKLRFMIYKSLLTDDTEKTDSELLLLFKQWLSTHNAEIVYTLANPTEQNIELPQLNLFEGTNIIEMGTETQATTSVVYITKV